MDKDNSIGKFYINEKYLGNKGNIAKFEATEIMLQLEKKICKIIKKKKGTGFFIKIPYKYPDIIHYLPVLVTNNHILGEEDLFINNIINLTLNDDKEKRCLKIDKSRKIFTDKELDVTIIEIKPKEDGINEFLDLDDEFNNGKFREKEDIYILQYPFGEKSSFSLGILKKIENKTINHNCSTISGSSGSPILLRKNFKVIGVHMADNEKFLYNHGTLIKFAIDKFKTKYPHHLNQINHNNKIEMILDNNEKEDIYIFNYSNYKKGIKGIILHDNSNQIKIFINNGNEEVYNGEIKLPKGLLKIRIEFEVLIKNCKAMFYKLGNLISIDLSSFVTSEVEDMSYMFSDCINLKNIKSNFETIKVAKMNSMFNNCSKLEYLNLSTFNTNKVEDMSYMFNNCSNLKSLDLKSFCTENVENMALMFNNCSSLESLDLSSSFDTKNVKDMSYMFYKCKYISSINLRSFNTQNVKNMAYMFCSCNNLIGLDLSSFKTQKVENMSCMFMDCTKLMSLNISSFDIINNINMKDMFKDCRSLEEIYVDKNRNEDLIDMQVKKDNINPILKLEVNNH